jgi:predicted RecB family endonuclease
MPKNKKDILGEAIKQLKRQGRSEPVPQEILDETARRIADSGAQSVSTRAPRFAAWNLSRLAAAAVILIAAGYGLGRVSAPKPDMDALRAALLPALTASLEPVIRQRAVEEAARNCQQTMVAAYVRLRDDLTEQYRTELNRFAVQTFTASNTVTNHLLEQLLASVKTSQLNERQLFAAALEQIESQRVEDSTALGTALVSLAAQTENALQRTRQDMVRLLADTQPDTSNPTQENLNSMN